GADVLVCGYRAGALERFGLAADALAERHPGLVIVYVDAWGHTGPWATRHGFDSVVQAPTGIAMAESPGGGEPGALPCQLLDHGTGYLAAAAVMDGLRRQASEGGTHVRRVSLARTAWWLTVTEPAASSAEAPGATADNSWLVEVNSVNVRVTAVQPPGLVGGRPLAWPAPGTAYGAD